MPNTPDTHTLSNTNIAWTRTTFTTFWLGLVLWGAAKLGWKIDITDPWTVGIIGLTGGVVWRLSELLAKVKYLGYILFGINRMPGYADPPPVNPANPEPAPDGGFANNDVVWTIVGILAIVALIIFIIPKLG